MNGDYVLHGVSAKIGQESNWDELVEIITNTTKTIAAWFPDTPILPSIGNNDVEFHYQAPTPNNSDTYYSTLYNIWFDDVMANYNYTNLTSINETFM